jgi:hypothetical protein
MKKRAEKAHVRMIAGEPISNATRMVAAQQTIYHDAKRPSALRFRVLPR